MRQPCRVLPRPVLEVGVKAAVEQNQEAEAGRSYTITLPDPGVRSHARGIVQPITGVGEGLVQCRKQLVAGVIILVESDVGSGLSVADSRKQYESSEKFPQHPRQYPLHTSMLSLPNHAGRWVLFLDHFAGRILPCQHHRLIERGLRRLEPLNVAESGSVKRIIQFGAPESAIT